MAKSDSQSAASRSSGESHLAEILALALVEKGLVDKDDIAAELDAVAATYRDAGDNVGASRVIMLANSIRAGRIRRPPAQ